MAGPSPWNAGAWFGVQVGSTVWLAICALVLVSKSPSLAALVFGLFLLVNIVGAGLWRSRRVRSIGSALRIFLLVYWASGVAAILAVDRAGLWTTLALGGSRNVSATTALAMLTVMAAALALLFRLRERSASGTSSGT